MRDASGHGLEVETLRCLLAVLAAETKLIRLRHDLDRKYDPNQPRAPAGQSDGGRWVSDGRGSESRLIDRLPHGQGRWSSFDGGSASDSSTREETTTDGGARILSLRIRSKRGEWDDQHAVVTPDGDSRIFENSGATRTIRDGESGEVLSSGTFASSEPQSEATVQQVFLPLFVVTPAVKTTLEAAALLFTYLAARDTRFGKAPGRTALRYDFDPDPDKKFPLIWVGRIDQATLDQACPRNAEVQAVTDEATKRLTALHPLLGKAQLGTMIHGDVAGTFIDRSYPDLRVEFSIGNGGKVANYGEKDSARLDLYELSPNQTVCVYDYKTGDEVLKPARALFLARAAKMYYPQAKGIIVIQVRPIK